MKIRIVMCPADRAPYVTHIEDSLKNMQQIVGGYIEAVTLTEDCALICNEEGLLLGLPDNKSVCFHGIVGDAFLVGVDGEEFCDLSDESKDFLLQQCKKAWRERNGA